LNGSDRLTRTRALALLAAITVVGGWMRFYNLTWSGPYYHFHIDEHFVFAPADLMRRSLHDAAMAPKFFMYSPLPMYALNILRGIYEALNHALDLRIPADEIVYSRLGRGISAALGTMTIPVVYAIAARVAGRAAGVWSAAFFACSVVVIREAHFFSVDNSMLFFAALTLLASLQIAERGGVWPSVFAGLAFGGAILCKYSGAFLAAPIGIAWLASPDRPWPNGAGKSWVRWIALGALPLVVTVVTFFALDPQVLMYWTKFRDDIRTWVTEPLSGTTKPLWVAQFADVTNPRLYWFTNLLWWAVGPALEIWALAGFVWLLLRRDRRALVCAVFGLAYYAAAGATIAPMMRYTLPLAPALAIAGGVLSADLIARRGVIRLVATTLSLVVLAGTGLYAAAYMNVFRQPDSRVVAARYIRRNIPKGAAVMIEPSHNTPPMGDYFDQTDFYREYVWFDDVPHYNSSYQVFSIDVYRRLYQPRPDEEKRAYIDSKVKNAEWIVMDDTFLQFYQHLPASQHGVVKQYYQDLFDGKLGFELDRTFKVYPSLFGREINDDGAELTFRLFDHPRIFIFKRRSAG